MGNPTGQLLSYENMLEIVEFCDKYNLLLCADEVYQENIYVDQKEFHSFRKVVLDSEKDVGLFSLHSTSKGYFGECGLRGGYLETLNIEPGVLDQLYKLCSMSLCSNLPGQIAVELMLNPPAASDPSGPLFIKERDEQLASLKRRGEKLCAALNSLTGVSSNPSKPLCMPSQL